MQPPSPSTQVPRVVPYSVYPFAPPGILTSTEAAVLAALPARVRQAMLYTPEQLSALPFDGAVWQNLIGRARDGNPGEQGVHVGNGTIPWSELLTR